MSDWRPWPPSDLDCTSSQPLLTAHNSATGEKTTTLQDLVISKGGSVPKEFTQYDEEEAALRSKTSSPAPPYLRRYVAAAAPKS